MNVIIIEDELLAQAKLESMLLALDKNIRVIAKLNSVKTSLQWLERNPPPDVAFVDIQLSDDHSFEIFRKHKAQFPIIFTTAFDKYLLDSFEFNSIDYLLKPIQEDKLKRSLEKIKNLEMHFSNGNLSKMINDEHSPEKRIRIIVKKGTEFLALDSAEIAYFYTEHKVVFAKTFVGNTFLVSGNLSALEEELDCKEFFRINRKFIAHLKAIDRFKPDNGKILITLRPEIREEVHVSKEMAPAFRRWIEGQLLR
jgi:DNA-binding LytR/AlgR family response regulator